VFFFLNNANYFVRPVKPARGQVRAVNQSEAQLLNDLKQEALKHSDKVGRDDEVVHLGKVIHDIIIVLTHDCIPF
jgi:hypothetical protein